MRAIEERIEDGWGGWGGGWRVKENRASLYSENCKKKKKD